MEPAKPTDIKMLQAAAQTTYFYMAFAGNLGHGHQQGPKLLKDPGYLHETLASTRPGSGDHRYQSGFRDSMYHRCISRRSSQENKLFYYSDILSLPPNQGDYAAGQHVPGLSLAKARPQYIHLHWPYSARTCSTGSTVAFVETCRCCL